MASSHESDKHGPINGKGIAEHSDIERQATNISTPQAPVVPKTLGAGVSIIKTSY